MKNMIVYGRYCGVQKRALEILTEILLETTGEYPVCVSSDEFSKKEGFRYLYIGTKNDNKFISKKIDIQLSSVEEYIIKVKNNNVVICGYDDAGVLYGCIDFYNKYIKVKNTPDAGGIYKNVFNDILPDFTIKSQPSIKERGLWTWGHVIYDYKGYIDNMTRLKMNSLTIWNDFAPINARELIEYAHNSNIKIFWGFPWAWDTACAKIDVKNINSYTDKIISEYENSYAPLGVDGIYFQSFTEVKEEYIDGVLIADAVTEFVNSVSEKLYQKYPNLELQFGLHATSVNQKLEYIKNVNPKIRIVWEDCGAFPYHYLPSVTDEFEKTYDFTEKILSLRGENEKWGAVFKGFTCLDWTKFEHPKGPHYIGVSTEKWLESRYVRKHDIWRYVQAYWIKNADKMYDIIKLIQKESDGFVNITALVEDSMFEKHLFYPVALLGEMMWDCSRDIKEIMCEVALNDYVEFI